MGTTVARNRLGPSSREYPRMYGAISAPDSASAMSAGIPPYVRGDPDSAKELGGSFGYTPVCTGRSGATIRASERRSVYPRMYGAITKEAYAKFLSYGIPPYVRGDPLMSNR